MTKIICSEIRCKHIKDVNKGEEEGICGLLEVHLDKWFDEMACQEYETKEGS